jgi:hypothetical protein
MFTRDTRVPTTPAHLQASRGNVTCLRRDRAENVTIGCVVSRGLVARNR